MKSGEWGGQTGLRTRKLGVEKEVIPGQEGGANFLGNLSCLECVVRDCYEVSLHMRSLSWLKLNIFREEWGVLWCFRILQSSLSPFEKLVLKALNFGHLLEADFCSELL